jgi:hypothetical protein
VTASLVSDPVPGESSWRVRLAAQDLAWLGLVPAAVITLAAIEWLAPALDGALAPSSSYHQFTGLGELFAPEPLEEARFLIAISAPVALAAVVMLLGAGRAGRRSLDPAIIVIQAVILAFVAWTVTKTNTDLAVFPDYIAARNYLPAYLVGAPVLVAGIVIGIGATVLLFRDTRPGPRLRSLASSRLVQARWLPASVAVVAGAIWLLPAVVTDANVGHTGLIFGHVPIQFEDYMAAINGRTPLVNYVAWYSSLLPLLFAPVLSAFGSSITAFSLLECALSLAAVTCVYAAFVNVTKRRWAALVLFIPFLAITFVPWHIEPDHFRVYSGDYYAVFPNRLLGPFLVLWLFARHLRRGSPPLGIVYFAAGLTLLNNFEFGACCLLALGIASVLRIDRSAPLRAEIGDLLVQAAAGLIAALVLVSAITLIRVGELPDPSVLTYWSRLFGRQGYSLLPMAVWGFQWALYFTYLGALLVAAVRFIRVPEDRILTPLLAFVAIFGLTTGQYFGGRSEGTQLIVLLTVWGLNLALLTWLVWGSLRGAEARSSRRYVLPAAAVLVGFGVMIASVARIPAPWQQLDRITSGGPHVLDRTAAQHFVEARTHPGEAVLVVSTRLDHRIAERAGVRNVSPWSSVAFFSAQEVNRAVDNLQEEDGSKIFERYAANGAPQAGQVEAMLRQAGFRLTETDPVTKLNLWVRPG